MVTLSSFRGVGGHGSLLSGDGRVLKPLPSEDPRSARELAFYEALRGPGAAGLAPLTPAFFGVREVSGMPHLDLEDLTAHFLLPCVLDVKMGARSAGADAAPEKVAREAAKWPPQARLGLRFSGMRVGWRAAGGAPQWRECSGEALRGRLPDDGGDAAPAAALREFLGGGGGEGATGALRRDVLPPLLARLDALRAWFSTQRQFLFYGSSLLIVYEGDGGGRGSGAGGGAGAAASGGAPAAVEARMIDFAHVWSADEKAPAGCDEGYLLGLATLERVLRGLLDSGGADAAAVKTPSSLFLKRVSPRGCKGVPRRHPALSPRVARSVGAPAAAAVLAAAAERCRVLALIRRAVAAAAAATARFL